MPRKKKTTVAAPEETKVKPKVKYQVSDLAYSKYALGCSGIWHVKQRFVPEFIRFMGIAGYTVEESKTLYSVDDR